MLKYFYRPLINNLHLQPLSQFSTITPPTEKQSFKQKYFSKERITASENFNSRHLMLIPSFFTLGCCGAPWGWSVAADYMTKEYGFVVSSAMDWTLGQSTAPLSYAFVLQGIMAAAASSWQIKNGPRYSIATAACLMGSGYALAAIGIHYHNLYLFYFGYGFLGGSAIGVAYTQPIQILMQWYKDKKGIAGGVPVAGFGAGGMVFPQIVQSLNQQFVKMPTYLGEASKLNIINQEGRLYTQVGDTLKEVVIANKKDIAALPYDLQEGVYLVGSGNTGLASSLAVFGGLYFTVMMTSAFVLKYPSAKYLEKFKSLEAGSGAQNNVTHITAIKTPQFASFFSVYVFMAIGGAALISVSKSLIGEVFRSSFPAIITANFTKQYVMFLSLGSLAGRLFYSYISDALGRKRLFNIMAGACIPLYCVIPTLINQVAYNQSLTAFYMFLGTTFLCSSILGGTYACLPSYEADMYKTNSIKIFNFLLILLLRFGSKYVGAIHGRLLMASCVATYAGPTMIVALRSTAEQNAIRDLVSKVDPEKFLQKFGAGIEQTNTLFEAKTLTINKLMEIMPSGTVDPSSFLYDNAMYSISGLACLALLSNLTIKPVNPKYYEIIVQPVQTENKDVAKTEKKDQSSQKEQTVEDNKK